MSKFINPEDYEASIHQEILSDLIRNDQEILEICEDQAVEEMKGYLSGRYDCSKIFGAVGEERHPLVLMMVKDIALYHIFSIHNPRNMSEIRVNRHERACQWMKDVQKGVVSVPDLPKLETEQAAATSLVQIRSNKKRINHI